MTDRISQARQAGTHQRKSALPSLSPGPSPGPSPSSPKSQVPSPAPRTPARTHPIQFTWAQRGRLQPSTVSCPRPASLSAHPIQSYPSASASASRLPLTYVTLRHVRAKALRLHCHQTASPPIFSSPTFHSNKVDRTSTDIARPLSPSLFLLPSHHLGDLSCTLVINLHQFFHPHPSSTRITRAFTSIRIDPRHCFPPTRLGITSPNHPHYV